MQAHAEFAGTTKQYCHERKIPIQNFYSRRHAMCIATPMLSTQDGPQTQANKKLPAQSGQFVKAIVAVAPSSIVLQTHRVQLSLSTQCDPFWLANLLKALAA
jgi:hypothetical protein